MMIDWNITSDVDYEIKVAMQMLSQQLDLQTVKTQNLQLQNEQLEYIQGEEQA